MPFYLAWIYSNFSRWNFKFFSHSELSYGTNQDFMPFIQAQFFVAQYPQNLHSVVSQYRMISKLYVGLFCSLSRTFEIYINFVPQINLSRRWSIGASKSGKYFMWEKIQYSCLITENYFFLD